MKIGFAILLLPLAGCSDTGEGDDTIAAISNAADADRDGGRPPIPSRSVNAVASIGAGDDLPPYVPPAPGEPGGLPDDRTPVSEAPFTPQSAQGAANVVQTYYALIEQGRYREAWALWSDGGAASGMDPQAFARSFDKYRDYRANIGAPGRIEGAAGSLYVDVPVQVFGRLKDGTPFNRLGSIRLRRVNDVPGSSTDQRRWHIAASGVRPRPAP